MATPKGISPDQSRLLRKRLQGADLEALAAEIALRKTQDSRDHFLPFMRRVWPEFVQGRHHQIMADVFERIDKGEAGSGRSLGRPGRGQGIASQRDLRGAQPGDL